jgi:chromosome segregation ATPase
VFGGADREDFLPTQENLENLRNRIETFRRENALLIEYARQKGADLLPQGAVIETTHRRQLKNKRSSPLPTARKLEVAKTVNDTLDKQLADAEKKFNDDIEQSRARLVQINIRDKEMDKEKAQFQREIIEEARDERTGKIIGEKVISWFESTIKDKETKRETLKLKKDSMSVKIKQTHARLEQKKDLGEKLQQVDYDQLQIDNEGFQDEIAKLSQELAKLQKTSSSVVSKLQEKRNELAQIEKECGQMQQSISQKQNAINKYEGETKDVIADHEKLASSNEDIATKKSEYRVPDVTDYIEKKAKIYEQAKVIKDWERKVQLAEMNVKRLRKELAAIDTPRK